MTGRARATGAARRSYDVMPLQLWMSRPAAHHLREHSLEARARVSAAEAVLRVARGRRVTSGAGCAGAVASQAAAAARAAFGLMELLLQTSRSAIYLGNATSPKHVFMKRLWCSVRVMENDFHDVGQGLGMFPECP